ncbi:ATP-grasp domain-containing protein [Algoriella sp.]|uniref:ATP-grasp domain-containing protein n=1 Tax=Algoriella sp. TaxID=1872434 RepID=UPI002FC8FEBF
MKIAVLGASYLQLPLVQKAKSNGIEIHCFAWDDGKAVCKAVADYFYDISVLEKEIIFDKCKEIGIDGVLTIATDICIPTIAYIAEKLNLVGNTYQTALLTTNKGLMRNCFRENDILSPFYQVIENYSQLKKVNFPLIVKPVDRSGSLGVVKVEDNESLQQAIDNATTFSFSKQCIVEEFMEGEEVSVETVSWKGKHQIITITDKVITNAPYFVEIAHHQPSTHNEKIIAEIEKTTLEILNATQVTNGISHIELMITKNGHVKAIEIGSRMGGDFIGSDLVQLSTGIDFLQVALDCALGTVKFPIQKKLNKNSGIYFLSKDTEYLLPLFNTDNQNVKIVKKEILSDKLLSLTSSNDRSGYLIYQSNQKEYLV